MHQQALVDAVIRRLTREPMTPLEWWIVLRLRPGKCARWCTTGERRFLRSLYLDHVTCVWAGTIQALTYKQRQWLWALAWKYQTKLGPATLNEMRQITRRGDEDRSHANVTP